MPNARASNLNYKTLICNNIPDLFLDKYVARAHFSRFGTLVNFVLRPRRMSCTVSYANEEQAAEALSQAGVFHSFKFDISYAKNDSPPAQRTEEWIDTDVQAELNLFASGTGGRHGANISKYVTGNNNSSAGAGGGGAGSGSGSGTNHTNARQASNRSNISKGNNSLKKELENTMRKAANTSEEKYFVLDARDKLLRLSMNRVTDLKDAVKMQGCCPDMCPEKERVLREFQRQIAVYEVSPDADDAISHKLAVKQYSRSSADQETPLPHELRPEPVLHMTMAYLMQEIINNTEYLYTQAGDWFHFVWDRTRAIRKEITQQELCSTGAVQLVEQCARFHIHCAARLVGEDPSVFDSKINAENLTKCLQTLKYMYHDLRLKGVQCPCEAEFRGYIVLLNLADANFLWDVSQLPPHLQVCTEIKHAIQFYLALQDTNYVRFFKLLRSKETTYLSACILVMYFTPLRVLGLQRIIKAYSPSRNKLLALSSLKQMLGFPNLDETADFLLYHGLKADEKSGVILTRFQKPSVDYKLARQVELVDSKRTRSVGETICGGPLPSKSLYEDHEPHSSFNELGQLNAAAWTADDQVLGKQAPLKVAQSAWQTQPASLNNKAEPTPAKLSKGDIFKMPNLSTPALSKPKLPKEFKQPQQQMPEQQPQQQQPQQQFMQKAQLAMAAQQQQQQQQQLEVNQQQQSVKETPAELLTGIDNNGGNQSTLPNTAANGFGAVTTDADRKLHEMQEAKRRAIEEEKTAELRRLTAIKEANDRKIALMNALAEQKRKELRMQQELQQRQLKRFKINAASDIILNSLIDNMIAEICVAKMDYIHNTSNKLFTDSLDDLIAVLAAQEYQLQFVVLRCVLKWRRYRRKQQRKENLWDCLPLKFATLPPGRLYCSTMHEPLRLMRRYRLGEPCNFSALLAGFQPDPCVKLDLWALLKTTPQALYTPLYYFKLLLCLPDGDAGLKLSHSFQRGVLLQPPLQSHQQAPAADHSLCINALHNGVALCVRQLFGTQMGSSEELAHADGIVFYVSLHQLDEAQKRLQKLQLKLSNFAYQRMVFITYDDIDMRGMDKLAIRQELQLQHFKERPKIIGSWLLPHSSASQVDQLVKLLKVAILHLTKLPNSSRSQLIQVPFREWIINHLGRELFERLREESSAHELIKMQCISSPEHAVHFYNEAVRRLQLVAAEDLEHWPQLPLELRSFVPKLPSDTLQRPNHLEYFVEGWQTHAMRQQFVDCLGKAMLPEMTSMPDSTDPQQVCQWLLSYIVSSQAEDRVEEIAMHSSVSLHRANQSMDNGLAFVELVEHLAQERLQFVLRSSSRLPVHFVYRSATLRSCFLTPWIYDWHRNQAKAAGLPLDITNIEVEEPEGSDSVDNAPNNNLMDFDKIVARAQAILQRKEERNQVRHRTRDNCPASAETQSEETSALSKRMRLAD